MCRRGIAHTWSVQDGENDFSCWMNVVSDSWSVDTNTFPTVAVRKTFPFSPRRSFAPAKIDQSRHLFLRQGIRIFPRSHLLLDSVLCGYTNKARSSVRYHFPTVIMRRDDFLFVFRFSSLMTLHSLLKLKRWQRSVIFVYKRHVQEKIPPVKRPPSSSLKSLFWYVLTQGESLKLTNWGVQPNERLCKCFWSNSNLCLGRCANWSSWDAM